MGTLTGVISPSRSPDTTRTRYRDAAKIQIVKLASDDGVDALEIVISGYQFPDAEDPRKRYSWHMITGRAANTGESWTFRYPALTCDESPRVSTWLRHVARWHQDSGTEVRPAKLTFTEPNLTLDIVGRPARSVAFDVELDLEFRSPRNSTQREAGATPNLLHLTMTSEALLTAAVDWEQDLARYPDLLA